MSDLVEFTLTVPAEEVNLLRLGEMFRIVRRSIDTENGQVYKVTITAERPALGIEQDPAQYTWGGWPDWDPRL